MDAGAAPPEGADQLGDQALPLEAPDAGDDRHPAVEVEAEGVGAGFNHESFEVHPRGFGAPARQLEPKDLLTRIGPTGLAASAVRPPAGRLATGRPHRAGAAGAAAHRVSGPPARSPRRARAEIELGRGCGRVA